LDAAGTVENVQVILYLVGALLAQDYTLTALDASLRKKLYFLSGIQTFRVVTPEAM
jgi:hypothetical protein